MSEEDNRRMDSVLLASIRERLPELRKLLDEVSDMWAGEDGVYRFYHYSFKVFFLQSVTEKAARMLRSLDPGGQGLHPLFEEIVKAGTGIRFNAEIHNADWATHVRPIVEAFFHARYFLEMAVKYGEQLEEAPSLLPSGWASLLELYKIR